MKYLFSLLALLSVCIPLCGEELSPETLQLKEKLSKSVKIGTIGIDTLRDSDDRKIEIFKFHTYQDERDKDLNFRVRVTIEMTDKAGQTCFAQLNREQGSVHEDYTGEDDWEFQISHGDLDKPKVSAYVVQYGILENGTFIPVSEKLWKVDSVDEITKRTSCRTEFAKPLHSYWYRNTDDEVVSSNPN
jgi:hypothetical protein